VLIAQVTRVPEEGRPSGHAFEENASERVEIGARIDDPLLKLLRSHVGRRASVGIHVELFASRTPEVARDPQVEEHGSVVALEEDVRGLEIAMHEPLAVQVGERRAEPTDQCEQGAERRCVGAGHERISRAISTFQSGLRRGCGEGRREPDAAARRAESPKMVAQRASFEAGHRDPGHAVGGDVCVEQAHDIRVTQAAERLDLETQRRQVPGVFRAARGLDRHDRSRVDVLGM
jgi:hypothetical protein